MFSIYSKLLRFMQQLFFLASALGGVTIIVFCYWWIQSTHKPWTISILVWTNIEIDTFRTMSSESYCESYNIPGKCMYILDRSQYKEAVGILFLGRPKGFEGVKHRVPPVRYPWQYYVLYSPEPAAHREYRPEGFRNFLSQPGFFNLTSTFRSDSDLPIPYLRTIQREQPCPSCLPNSTLLGEKDKLLIWFVSNCNASSQRDEYFEKLTRYIPGDKYGSCGVEAPECKAWGTVDGCTGDLTRRSKFHFSAENAICKDYVTEKLLRPLLHSAVPVVLATKDVRQIAPPNSYIDVGDFKSPKHLARYLLELDRNDTAYKEYFSWREHYEVVRGSCYSPDVFCHLCEYIHTRNKSKTVDFQRWFFNQSECKNPYEEINFD